MLDTAANRSAMPTSDFSKWTSCESLAGLLKMWADGVNRPSNSSFALIKSVNGSAIPEF